MLAAGENRGKGIANQRINSTKSFVFVPRHGGSSFVFVERHLGVEKRLGDEPKGLVLPVEFCMHVRFCFKRSNLAAVCKGPGWVFVKPWVCCSAGLKGNCDNCVPSPQAAATHFVGVRADPFAAAVASVRAARGLASTLAMNQAVLGEKGTATADGQATGDPEELKLENFPRFFECEGAAYFCGADYKSTC